MTPRAALLVALALTAPLGCDGLSALFASKPRTAAGLDAPETVAALRARARGGVRAEVRRQPRSRFDFRCGHSGACLVLLPVALAASALPPMLDLGTLTRGDETLFEGVYDLRGRLVMGVARDGGVRREIRRVRLRGLDQSWLAEVARAPILPDGGVGPVTRSRLAPQLHLVASYRAALARERTPAGRGRLAVEAVFAMGREAIPLALPQIEARDDVAVAVTLGSVCSPPTHQLQVWIDDAELDAARRALLGAFVDRPTPEAAAVALRCPVLTDAQRARLVALLSREVCEADGRRANRALRALTALDPALRCEGPRAPIVRALRGDAVDPAALGAALATQDQALRDEALSRVDAARYASLLLAAQGPARLAALARLASSSWRPDLAAGRELLAAWPQLPADEVARTAVVDLLARLSPEHATALRGSLPAAGDVVAARASLPLRVALGAPGAIAEAAREVHGEHVVWMVGEGGPNFSSRPGRAIYAQALWCVGCVEAEVRGESATCAGPAPWPRPEIQRSLWASEARRLAPR